MEIKTKESFRSEKEKMKSAHQEKAAYKIEDHTGAKLIWIEAVSTCVLKRSLNNRPPLEQPNSSVQSVLISPAWNSIVSKSGLFFFSSFSHRTREANRVQMKSHFATDCDKSYIFH